MKEGTRGENEGVGRVGRAGNERGGGVKEGMREEGMSK